jgi:hypothetical protein
VRRAVNKLERVIVRGAWNAEKTYEKLTGGHWLSHGPESFLQVAIALALRRSGNFVYIDASIKKAERDKESARRGRPPGNLKQRPDISVWFKATDRLRAIIETKLATWGDLQPVGRDAKKIERLMKQKHSACGYLMVYSEARGKKRMNKLKKRFRRWSKELGWKLIHATTSTSGNPDWAWGFGLFRCVPMT